MSCTTQVSTVSAPQTTQTVPTVIALQTLASPTSIQPNPNSASPTTPTTPTTSTPPPSSLPSQSAASRPVAPSNTINATAIGLHSNHAQKKWWTDAKITTRRCLALSGFVGSLVVLWWTYSSLVQAKRANQLAELADILAYRDDCRAQNQTQGLLSSDCLDILRKPIPKPSWIHRVIYRRSIDERPVMNNTLSAYDLLSGTVALLGTVSAYCMVVYIWDALSHSPLPAPRRSDSRRSRNTTYCDTSTSTWVAVHVARDEVRNSWQPCNVQVTNTTMVQEERALTTQVDLGAEHVYQRHTKRKSFAWDYSTADTDLQMTQMATNLTNNTHGNNRNHSNHLRPRGESYSARSQLYRVLQDFAPTADDELELKVDDRVRLLHEYDDGWCLCSKIGGLGVAPRQCLASEPLASSSDLPPEKRLTPVMDTEDHLFDISELTREDRDTVARQDEQDLTIDGKNIEGLVSVQSDQIGNLDVTPVSNNTPERDPETPLPEATTASDEVKPAVSSDAEQKPTKTGRSKKSKSRRGKDDGFADDEEPPDACYACKEVFEKGKAFELAGKRWHIDCFRCNTCSTLLDDDANLLLLGDGSLICNNCTYSCSKCAKKIEDIAILTGDQAFCSGCFRCRNCKKKIENLRYARTSQGIFCMHCHESLMKRRRKHGAHRLAEKNATTDGTTSPPVESDFAEVFKPLDDLRLPEASLEWSRRDAGPPRFADVKLDSNNETPRISEGPARKTIVTEKFTPSVPSIPPVFLSAALQCSHGPDERSLWPCPFEDCVDISRNRRSTFVRKDDAERHMRAVHPDRRLDCPLIDCEWRDYMEAFEESQKSPSAEDKSVENTKPIVGNRWRRLKWT